MKIVCSANMPCAREVFGSLGDTVIIDGRSITANDTRDADILAIRSTTTVNRALLDGSAVRFVGTATIGMDHLDTAYLDSAGIKWCYSPGCNANSVCEYVITALLCVANRHGSTLEGKNIGIIGIGNIGSLVVKKAEALGMRVLQNDPPRQRSAAVAPRAMARQGEHTEFVSLDKVLEQADIVTLHVPLTKEGPDATFHLADETFFSKMKPGCIFLNTARGAVANTDALLAALKNKIVSHAVIDTWEEEPEYRKDLLERADIGTPHIAGYSFEGKVMGTIMVYREACRFLGIDPVWTLDKLLPAKIVSEVGIDADKLKDEAILWQIARQIYNIEEDDRQLRDCSKDRDRGAHFDGLRRNYPVRREFRFSRVTLKNTAVPIGKKIAEVIGSQIEILQDRYSRITQSKKSSGTNV